jgi:hypothetical protein
MMKMIETDIVSKALFDRLYAEAYPKISNERKRVGDVKLGESMFNELPLYNTAIYYVDDYPVGLVSYHTIQYNEKTYFFHRYPTYGVDQTGSRAWWYSEEFQQVNSQYIKNMNCAGVITIINPSSAAAMAVKQHFGSFGKYYNIPVEYSISVVLGASAESMLQGGRCLVIDLMDE